ncbi:MAG: hypothetical protein HC892_00595 [Saprospiraceae bacterium]|nr:hypothetical protein [Saprospiraceae bacterium]
MEFEEYFEIAVIYSHAVFEIGAYAKYMRYANELLVVSIDNNVQFFQGKDIFCQILFKKAAAHYNLMEYQAAAHVLKELIKIDPNYGDAIILLKRVTRKSKTVFIKTYRAIAVSLFLIAALVIAFELILVQSFWSSYRDMVAISRIAIFSLGLVVLILCDLYLRINAHYSVTKLVDTAKKKKGFS